MNEKTKKTWEQKTYDDAVKDLVKAIEEKGKGSAEHKAASKTLAFYCTLFLALSLTI